MRGGRGGQRGYGNGCSERRDGRWDGWAEGRERLSIGSAVAAPFAAHTKVMGGAQMYAAADVARLRGVGGLAWHPSIHNRSLAAYSTVLQLA